MGWLDYYYLIKRYGSVEKAPEKLRTQAAKANPNTPEAAQRLAERIWAERST